MKKRHIFRTLAAAILALVMVVSAMPICWAASSTSSQVVKNAQDMYDNIIDTYGSVAGYVRVLNNLKFSYQQSLIQAEYYNEVYDTIVDFGGTGITLICSIASGDVSSTLETVRDEAIGAFLDELMNDVPKLTLEQFIYSQAKAGASQVNLTELMDIGFKIERDCSGRVSSVGDAVRFIRANQEIKMGFAALQMGRDLYYEQLNASPWQTIGDMFTKHILSHLSEKLNANVLEQYRRDLTAEKIYELFSLVAGGINNKHFTAYTNSITEIMKETRSLISYTIDDFGKPQTTSPGTSTPGNQNPPQTPAPSIPTVTHVKCHYANGPYNEGMYEGEWSNGKPHGWGKIIYDGFEDNLFYSIRDSDGTVLKALSYEGNFVNGFRNGYGTVTYERGYKEEGEFNGVWVAGKIIFAGKLWYKDEGYWPATKTATSAVEAKFDFGDWVSTKQRYTIRYNANGGQNPPNSQEKVKDTALTLTTDIPTRAGYIFLGWSTSANAAKETYHSGDLYRNNAGATLYAVWKANTFTISYHANGGENAPGPQTKSYGKALTLSSAVPTREGYTFAGWSTSSTAANAAYQAGDMFQQDASTTLYAVWKKLERSAKVFRAYLGRETTNAYTDAEVLFTEYSISGYSTGEAWLTFEDIQTGERVYYYGPVASQTRTSVLSEYTFEPGHTYKIYFTDNYGKGSMISDSYITFTYAGTNDAFLRSAPSEWAKESVVRAYDMKLLPDYMLEDYSLPATRIDFVRLAYAVVERRCGLVQQILYDRGIISDQQTGPALTFTDVPQYNGYDAYDQYRVAVLYELGIIKGVGDNKFEPNRAITREEAAVMLSRVYSFIKWGAVSQYTLGGTDNQYNDSAVISPWAFYDVYNMRAVHVMNGIENNHFAPQGVHSIEESIVTFVRLLEQTADEPYNQ